MAKGRDEETGKEQTISLDGLQLFLKEDAACRRYLGSLERADSGDAGDLYKQQAGLLAELATLDARLDEIDAEKDRAKGDAAQYLLERGGDAKKLLLVPMRGLMDDESSEEDVPTDVDAKAARRAQLNWRSDVDKTIEAIGKLAAYYSHIISYQVHR